MCIALPKVHALSQKQFFHPKPGNQEEEKNVKVSLYIQFLIDIAAACVLRHRMHTKERALTDRVASSCKPLFIRFDSYTCLFLC